MTDHQDIFKFLRPARLEEPTTKQYKHWKKTLHNFLTKTNTTDDNDKLLLLTNFVHSDIYDHISDVTTYAEALAILDTMYIMPINIVFNRHVLKSTKQKAGENLEDFLQRLKTLGKECEFKAVTAAEHQEEAIRDAFIAGLCSTDIQRRLLEENNMTLSQAFEKARALYTAQKNSEEYQSTSTYTASMSEKQLGNIPHMSPHNTMNSPGQDDHHSSAAFQTYDKCYYCGGPVHPRYQCPARNALCKCGRRGHYTKVCRNPNTNSQGPKSNRQNQHSSAAAHATLATIKTSSSSKVYIPITVNGIHTEGLLDTGSTDNYIKEDFVASNKLSVHSRTPITVKLANGSDTHVVRNACHVSLSINNSENNGKSYHYPSLELSVLNNLIADVVLGEQFMRQHESVHIRYGGNKPPLTLCGLEAMVNVPKPELFKYLKANCKPVVTKPRKFSKSDSKFIEETVTQQMRDDIIELSKSPWRSQVLVVNNENHRRRMVQDYSQTINPFTYLDAYPLPSTLDIVSKVAQYSHFSTLDLKSAYHQIMIPEEDRIYTAFQAGDNLYQYKRMPYGLTNAVSVFQRIISHIIKSNDCKATFNYSDNVTVCGKNKSDHDQNLQYFIDVAKKHNITFNESKSILSTDSIKLLGYEVSNQTLKPDQDRVKALHDMRPPQNMKDHQRVLGLFSYYAQWIPNYSETVKPLIGITTFPWSSSAQQAFNTLKNTLSNATLHSIDDSQPFQVETDASDTTIAATLTQNKRPVAFFARTLVKHEIKYASVEKEALAIFESIMKWAHLLSTTNFTLVTDQRSVSFMFNNKQSSKIKNDKIQRWRMELSPFQYDIIYRPGKDNIPADTLSRACTTSAESVLTKLHEDLCHPGVTRFFNFIRSKNLPYSVNDVKTVISNCKGCSILKPKFVKPLNTPIIKATQPFERISIDFKGPLPSVSKNKYMLTIIDEYSRFPFVYPCKDMVTDTVIGCLNDLFSIFGMPGYVHSDRGPSFMSEELKSYLHSKGIATSHTTKYNPSGNGQCERYNGVIWKSIRLSLHSRDLPVTCWENVLTDVLHSQRSLLNTSTNCSPHERMFQHSRRSSNGTSIPTWLTQSKTALVKRHVRSSKHDPLVDEVEVLDVSPSYVRVKYASGREDNVSLKHIAPSCNSEFDKVVDHSASEDWNVKNLQSEATAVPTPVHTETQNVIAKPAEISDNNGNISNNSHTHSGLFSSDDETEEFLGFRRSARIREKAPVNYKV